MSVGMTAEEVEEVSRRVGAREGVCVRVEEVGSRVEVEGARAMSVGMKAEEVEEVVGG